MGFNERLEALMASKPVTRPMEMKDLSLATGISTKQLNGYMRSKESLDKAQYLHLKSIADYFNVSVEFLLHGTPTVNPDNE